MAVSSTELKRVFRYQALQLADPGAHMTPDQVRQVYAGQYPELNSAVIEGPDTKGGTSTYTFARAAGSKGLSHVDALKAIAAGTYVELAAGPTGSASPRQLKEAEKCAKTAAAIVAAKTASLPLTPAATAYSLFG